MKWVCEGLLGAARLDASMQSAGTFNASGREARRSQLLDVIDKVTQRISTEGALTRRQAEQVDEAIRKTPSVDATRPVSIAARAGTHCGAGEYARTKLTALEAKLRRCGRRTSAYTEALGSSSRPSSESMTRRRMFGGRR